MTSLLSSEAVETGITPGGTTGAFRDVLSKHHAHRRKPPVHFTDMSDGEREEALKELGYPKFRASQLARHYFSHYTTDVAGYSDFPQDQAGTVKQRFFPDLITPLLEQTADNGALSKLYGSFSTVPVLNQS